MGVNSYKNYILVMLFVKYISDVWQDHYDALKEQYGDDEELAQQIGCGPALFTPS